MEFIEQVLDFVKPAGHLLLHKSLTTNRGSQVDEAILSHWEDSSLKRVGYVDSVIGTPNGGL